MKIKPAATRAGFAGYQFGVNDDEDQVKTEQTALEDLPQTDDDGKAKFAVTLDKMPNTSRPLEAEITVRLVESGGRAVERNLTLPIVPAATMIGVRPLFSGKSLGEGESAGFDVIVAAPAAGSTSRSRVRAAWRTAASMWQPTSRAASRCRSRGAAIGSMSRVTIAAFRRP